MWKENTVKKKPSTGPFPICQILQSLSTSPTGIKSWCHSHSIDILGMQNISVMGSHRLLPRVQRKTPQTDTLHGEQEALQSEPGRMVCVWSCECYGDSTVRYARTVEHLWKHLKSGNTTSPERGPLSKNRQNWESQAAQDLWGSKSASNTQVPGMELEDLKFTLFGFALAWVHFSCHSKPLLLEWDCLCCTYVLEVHKLLFTFKKTLLFCFILCVWMHGWHERLQAEEATEVTDDCNRVGAGNQTWVPWKSSYSP